MEHKILVETLNLKRYFKLDSKTVVKAVDDVSFHMHSGEILSIVGESGSGKSTIVKCMMNICPPTAGTIMYDGINISNPKERRKNKKRLQRDIQIIFQDSTSALNQRMTVEQIIAEPLKINRRFPNREKRRKYIISQLEQSGLDKSFLNKYPSDISGGQRQRVAIARALCMHPRLVIADEPIASLDVSIQAQIINLFKKLQAEQGFSFLLISHDLSMVRFVSDRVAVMCRGKIVEVGPSREVCDNPKHPYTKALITAIPTPDPKMEQVKTISRFSDFDSLQNKQLKLVSQDHWVLQ